MIRKFTETDRISVPDLGSDLLPLELKAEKTRFGDHLSRNMAAADLLVLTVVSVRNAKLPGGKTVMTAVQEQADGAMKMTSGITAKMDASSRNFSDAYAGFVDSLTSGFSRSLNLLT